MDWKDVAGAVGKVAPLLGVLVGGPAGPAIGGIIAAALGTDSTPIAVQAAINADPQAALKLAQSESDNRVKLQAMVFAHAEAQMADETKRIELAVNDVQSARTRDTAFITSGRENKRADVMVVCDVVGMVACVLALMFFRKDIDASVITLLTTIASIFGLCLRDAHQFEFGSSRGSAEKTQLLAKQTPAVEPNVATAP